MGWNVKNGRFWPFYEGKQDSRHKMAATMKHKVESV
jgi:hypothetical protein